VIDVEPGTGWWTDILAPYLARTGGHYIAAGADLNDPAVGSEARTYRAAFEAKYIGKPALYGNVSFVGFGTLSGPLAPPGSVDLILVSRATHNWVRNGLIHKAFADFYAALKRGGILAIEDHRAPAGADPAKGDGMEQLQRRATAEARVRDHALARHEGLELGARGLQVAVVLSGLSIVTGAVWLFAVSGVLGAVSAVYALLAAISVI